MELQTRTQAGLDSYRGTAQKPVNLRTVNKLAR